MEQMIIYTGANEIAHKFDQAKDDIFSNLPNNLSPLLLIGLRQLLPMFSDYMSKPEGVQSINMLISTLAAVYGYTVDYTPSIEVIDDTDIQSLPEWIEPPDELLTDPDEQPPMEDGMTRETEYLI